MKTYMCYLEFGVSTTSKEYPAEICIFKGSDFSTSLCPVCEKSEKCLAMEIQNKMQKLFPNHLVEYCGNLISGKYNGWSIGLVNESEEEYERALCSISKDHPSMDFVAIEVDNWSITTVIYKKGKIIPESQKVIMI